MRSEHVIFNAAFAISKTLTQKGNARRWCITRLSYAHPSSLADQISCEYGYTTIKTEKRNPPITKGNWIENASRHPVMRIFDNCWCSPEETHAIICRYNDEANGSIEKRKSFVFHFQLTKSSPDSLRVGVENKSLSLLMRTGCAESWMKLFESDWLEGVPHSVSRIVHRRIWSVEFFFQEQ